MVAQHNFRRANANVMCHAPCNRLRHRVEIAKERLDEIKQFLPGLRQLKGRR